MTDRNPPDRRSFQMKLDLGKELMRLGHTPESFARVIGRNASGLRRAIRGETTVTPGLARDIIEGLYAEGWKGDPSRIMQFRNPASAPYVDSLVAKTQRAPLQPITTSRDAAVSRALANLMQALGRKEVDRVYRSVFGRKPYEKDK